MAVDNPSAIFLHGLRRLGVDFSQTLTLGHQSLAANEACLSRLLLESQSTESAADFLRRSGGWADEFYGRLGATRIDSMDVSDYEGASLVQNLNDPIDAALQEQFTVVHDGGTLEHVFNFPNAIKSVLEMVRQGGHFISVSVANNYMGHGFYQFSPELFFRILSEENGFSIRCMLIHERIPRGRWFQVQDPQKYGRRVELKNRNWTYLLVAARREQIKPIFAKWPHQSDYVSQYQGIVQHVAQIRASRNGWARLKTLFPNSLKHRVKSICGYEPDESFRESCFQPISEGDVMAGRFSS